MPDELQHPDRWWAREGERELCTTDSRGASVQTPQNPARQQPSSGCRGRVRPQPLCAHRAPQGTEPAPHSTRWCNYKATSIPTFGLNSKDRHLLTETCLLFRTSSSGFKWLPPLTLASFPSASCAHRFRDGEGDTLIYHHSYSPVLLEFGVSCLKEKSSNHTVKDILGANSFK